MTKKPWMVGGLFMVAVLLVGGCAGHPKGMKSLRWLTDAGKEKVVELTLGSPKALDDEE
jgi:hypothetical protein